MKKKLIPLILLLISCGSRKTESNKYELKVDSISVNNERILKQNISFNDITSISAKDPLKPFIYNNKWYYNTLLTFDKSIIDDFEISDKQSSLSLERSEIKEDKKTDKKDNTILYIGLFFVLIIGIIVYVKFPSLKV